MNFEEAKEFQTSQKEVVAMLGAFLMSLKGFSELLINSDTDVPTHIRKMQPLVSDFASKISTISQFFNKYHYPTYNKEVIRPVTRITTLLGDQTLPSKKVEIPQFKSQLDSHLEGISEVMIATAQIIVPSIDANVRAGNSFSAYCFISAILDSVTSEVLVIDPYVDQSIFYRYLYRLPTSVNIKIITDRAKLSGERLRSYESVESLFLSEYLNYERKLFDNFHDRYLVTETHAYSLGGSIKDAAKKSDYSITQVTDEKRNELLQIYA